VKKIRDPQTICGIHSSTLQLVKDNNKAYLQKYTDTMARPKNTATKAKSKAVKKKSNVGTKKPKGVSKSKRKAPTIPVDTEMREQLRKLVAAELKSRGSGNGGSVSTKRFERKIKTRDARYKRLTKKNQTLRKELLSVCKRAQFVSSRQTVLEPHTNFEKVVENEFAFSQVYNEEGEYTGVDASRGTPSLTAFYNLTKDTLALMRPKGGKFKRNCQINNKALVFLHNCVQQIVRDVVKNAVLITRENNIKTVQHKFVVQSARAIGIELRQPFSKLEEEKLKLQAALKNQNNKMREVFKKHGWPFLDQEELEQMSEKERDAYKASLKEQAMALPKEEIASMQLKHQYFGREMNRIKARFAVVEKELVALENRSPQFQMFPFDDIPVVTFPVYMKALDMRGFKLHQTENDASNEIERKHGEGTEEVAEVPDDDDDDDRDAMQEDDPVDDEAGTEEEQDDDEEGDESD